jgi:hypothetical protein
MVAALGAALGLTVGMSAPALATHEVGYQECLNTHHFFEFYRLNEPLLKSCFAGENPQTGNELRIRRTEVTRFYAGNNRARVGFYEANGNYHENYYFPGNDVSCDRCTVVLIAIY